MRFNLVAMCIVSTLTLVGCGKSPEQSQSAAKKPMNTTDKEALVASGKAYMGKENVAMELKGAGASFPAPLYDKWASQFHTATQAKVDYVSMGSSSGIKQIIAKTVDFGASDAPMRPEDLEEHGLIQFPTVIGGVVPVVNLKGVEPGKLVLDGSTLAKIYLGDIKKWNNPAIVALNEGVTLPDAPITTVFRSDGSGTTFNFTDYLAKAEPTWSKVGVNKSVKWPTSKMGTGVGGKGNEGVATTVARVVNSIGYVEYAYAKVKNMSHTAMKNAAGNIVQPSAETFKEAGNIDWSKTDNFYKVITNSETAQAWPIAASTFILVHKNPKDPVKTAGALNFFNWAYNEGDKTALDLEYVPFSDEAVALFTAKWNEVVGTDGKPVYTAQ